MKNVAERWGTHFSKRRRRRRKRQHLDQHLLCVTSDSVRFWELLSPVQSLTDNGERCAALMASDMSRCPSLFSGYCCTLNHNSRSRQPNQLSIYCSHFRLRLALFSCSMKYYSFYGVESFHFNSTLSICDHPSIPFDSAQIFITHSVRSSQTA